MKRYGSVCSGIEAASVAWHPLGWTPEFFAEIERFPSEVLAHHYGSNLPGETWSRNAPPNLGDMTRFQEWPDAALDVLVGGTPCQSFSVAGLRKGLADPRGNLALTYLAIADRYRPEWLVWENVPGVLSSDGGRDFGAFLGGLAELGYGFAYRVLDAQFVRVDGFGRAVPQRRRRVFVVGCLGGWACAGAVLFEPESLSGNPPPRREAGKRAAPTIAGGARGRGGYSTDDIPLTETFPVGDLDGASKSLNATSTASGYMDPTVETYIASRDVAPTVRAGGNVTGGDRPYGMDVDTCDSLLVTRDVAATLTRGAESGGKGGYAGRRQEDDDNLVAHAVAPAITSNPYGDHESREGLLVAHTLRAEGFDASEDGTGRGIPLVPVCFNSREDPEVTFDRSGPLGASSPQAQAIAYGIRNDAGREGEAKTASADASGNVRLRDPGFNVYEGFSPTLDAGAPHAVASGWAVRRLTPTECERLQGFPDGYTAITRSGKPAADGPRYKALGNSMAVNAMRWIGRRIEMVDALRAEIGR